MTQLEKTKTRRPDKATMRRGARLSAVQALHAALHDSNRSPNLVEFRQHWFGQTDPDSQAVYAPPDEDLFSRLTNGAASDREALTEELDRCLAPKWRVSRLEMTMQALLLVGAWEVRAARAAKDSDAIKIALKDYTELADSFFGAQEAGLVNAVLDRAWTKKDASASNSQISDSDALPETDMSTPRHSTELRRRMTHKRLQNVSEQRTRELRYLSRKRNRSQKPDADEDLNAPRLPDSNRED